MWSKNHLRLLYIIDLYTREAASEAGSVRFGDIHPTHTAEWDFRSTWVRKIPLLVLIYEAIVAEVLDYDYAPTCVTIGTRRLYMNVSQEGCDDLDDLREAEMINALSISSSEYTTITSYQVSPFGEKLLKVLGEEGKKMVEEFCLPTLKRASPSPLSLDKGAMSPITPNTKGFSLGGNTTRGTDGSRNGNKSGVDIQVEEGSLAWHRYSVFLEDGEANFVLETPSGHLQLSTVTLVEDVSYVCSPYIPDSLQPQLDEGYENPSASDGAKINSNAQIGREVCELVKAGYAGDNVKDMLTEVIKLHYVKILVGEWIPFGANLIANMNEKLGAVSRVKTGLFTTLVDEMPDTTTFRQPENEIGSKVSVVGHEASTFCNFVADIRFEEDENIIQVEEFGVSVWKDGTVIYGLDVDCILDRYKQDISLDHLSRLLVDIHIDSSTIANTFISSYQRFLLNALYTDQPDRRAKYNLILAQGITPLMPADKYMDKEAHENELKQVLGATRTAFDLGGPQKEIIIFGSEGLLLTGDDSASDLGGMKIIRHEQMLLAFLSLMGRQLAIRQFFSRIFHSSHVLSHIKMLIKNYDKNPGSIPEIRKLQSMVSTNINLLTEVLSYIDQSLHDVSYLRGGHSFMELPEEPGADDVAGKRLYVLLNLKNTQHALLARVADMLKNLQGAKNDLDAMRLETDYIVQKEAHTVMVSMDAHTKNLEDSQRLQARANSSLEILQVILAGSLAFDIVDRFFLFYMSLDHSESSFKWVVDTPLIWFLINISVWMVFGAVLIRYIRHQTSVATGILSYRFVLNKKVNHERFMQYLSTKTIQNQDSTLETIGKAHTRKVQWEEEDRSRWRGTCPIFDCWYNTDPSNCLIYKVFVQAERVEGHQVWTEQDLQDTFERELIEAGVCSSINAQNDDWMDKSNLINPWKLRRTSDSKGMGSTFTGEQPAL